MDDFANVVKWKRYTYKLFTVVESTSYILDKYDNLFHVNSIR